MSASVLYSDDCCEVSSDGIKIFWYWLPAGSTKFVPFEDIVMVHPTPEHSLSPLDRKTWGMGVGK